MWETDVRSHQPKRVSDEHARRSQESLPSLPVDGARDTACGRPSMHALLWDSPWCNRPMLNLGALVLSCAPWLLRPAPSAWLHALSCPFPVSSAAAQGSAAAQAAAEAAAEAAAACWARTELLFQPCPKTQLLHSKSALSCQCSCHSSTAQCQHASCAFKPPFQRHGWRIFKEQLTPKA